MYNIDGLLDEWASYIVAEIESSGFSAETLTYRMMRCGVIVHSGTFPLPNYWPKKDLVKVNDAVWSLPVKDRNIMVMKRILRYSYMEIAREHEKSKTWAYNQMERIEHNLVKTLKK